MLLILPLSLGGAISLVLLIFFGLPLFFLFLYFVSLIKVVRQGTIMVVERFGRYHATWTCDNGYFGLGLHTMVPFVDSARKVVWRENQIQVGTPGQNSQRPIQKVVDRIDIREGIFDFPNQPIVTRDNVQIEVHPMVLYKNVDPARIAYETYDVSHCVEKLVQTTLRSIIGDMGLDDTLASREEINRGLMSRIGSICLNWGIMITRVEILEIVPTVQVRSAMELQLAKERERRTAIVKADGRREKMKTEAEGESQAAIARSVGRRKVLVEEAVGRAESRKLLAGAEAETIKIVSEALKQVDSGYSTTDFLIATKYLDAFEAMATAASRRTIYFPFESDVVGALRSL